jgi:ectoine hydroxylase-related dioxygenase (phytanoyl-CoA dioxygenase family)
MLQLATRTLGTHAVPFRATLFDKSSGSNWHVLWHQDRALPLRNRVHCNEWGPWSTKCGVLYGLAPASALERVVALRIHVDASTETNGPLRVIPGSHMIGVMGAAQISVVVRDVSANGCVVGRGGVLAMRPLLLHSSPKATDNERRRVLHIEYADRFDFGNGLRLCVA